MLVAAEIDIVAQHFPFTVLVQVEDMIYKREDSAPDL